MDNLHLHLWITFTKVIAISCFASRGCCPISSPALDVGFSVSLKHLNINKWALVYLIFWISLLLKWLTTFPCGEEPADISFCITCFFISCAFFFLIALLAFLHKHDLRETLIFVEYGPSVYIMCPEAWRNQVNVCIDQCSWIALTPSFHPQGETERPTGRWGGGKPWNFCRWHSH